MSYIYGLPAPLTGPCLGTTCFSGADGSALCGSIVVLCTAGSSDFTNPVQANDQEMCSYQYTDPTGSTTCVLYPLSGTLDHSGDTWSIFDSSSTVTIPLTVETVVTAPETILFAGAGGDDLSYFLSGGAAEASAAGTGSAVPSNSASLTSASAVASSLSSAISSAASAGSTTNVIVLPTRTPTATGKTTSVGPSTTSPGGSSSTTAAAATTKSGQEKTRLPSVAAFILAGLLAFVLHMP